MEIKCIEIRDEGTCIPAIAIRMIAAGMIENRFLWRCGYPPDGSGIILLRLADQRATSDPYEWNDRTHKAAHLYIEKNWDDLFDGAVVDARAVLGERPVHAAPEIGTEEET